MRFPDIPDGHYSEQAVDELSKRGIYKGRDDGTFGFGQHLSRQDHAVVLWRMIKAGYLNDQYEAPEPEPDPDPPQYDRAVSDVAGIEMAQAGESILVSPGVYQTGIVPKDGQRWEFAEGAALDGNGGPHAFSGPARDVIIVGGEFYNFDPPTQMAVIESTARRDLEGGWKVRNVWLHDNDEVGVRIGGHNTELIDSLIEDQGRLGFALQYGDGGKAIGNRIYRCNAERKYSPGFEAGGCKCWKTSNLLIENNYSAGHYGPGLWTDKDNIGTVCRGNVVEDCPDAAAGIFHEISFEALIENNTVRNCGKANWGYGAGILASMSDGVTVRNNVIDGCGRGIIVLCQNRGYSDRLDRPYYGRNLVATGNLISNSGHTGAVRADEDFGDVWNAVFEGNHYTNCGGFAWLNQWFVDFGRWQSYGHDSEGSWQI